MRSRSGSCRTARRKTGRTDGHQVRICSRAMKNFIVSLIVRDISKSEFNKTLDVDQNESKNIEYNNRRETEVPKVVSRNADEKRNRALS